MRAHPLQHTRGDLLSRGEGGGWVKGPQERGLVHAASWPPDWPRKGSA